MELLRLIGKEFQDIMALKDILWDLYISRESEREGGTKEIDTERYRKKLRERGREIHRKREIQRERERKREREGERLREGERVTPFFIASSYQGWAILNIHDSCLSL